MYVTSRVTQRCQDVLKIFIVKFLGKRLRWVTRQGNSCEEARNVHLTLLVFPKMLTNNQLDRPYFLHDFAPTTRMSELPLFCPVCWIWHVAMRDGSRFCTVLPKNKVAQLVLLQI